MKRLALLALATALTFACTTTRTSAASSDTVTTDTKETGSVQQGVGSSETPTNPPNETSGKQKPKASDVSTPSTQ